MPELPDIVTYLRAIESRMVGATLQALRVAGPFVLRTVSPSPQECAGRQVEGIGRSGKRIVIKLHGERFIVIHLMIAGRLHWKQSAPKLSGKAALAALDFATGSLLLTEVSTKKRASIHIVQGDDALRSLHRVGLEVLEASVEQFEEAIRRENHTLKRALTDPDLFSGIGNAYSDEILHRARLSPVKLSSRLSAAEISRLYIACKVVLQEWIDHLAVEAGDGFPEKVTAFRPEMAVHGRYGLPCPDCGAAVQRIAFADNELNYCAACQTDGRLLADRGLSRLLKSDWPRTLAEMEELRKR